MWISHFPELYRSPKNKQCIGYRIWRIGYGLLEDKGMILSLHLSVATSLRLTSCPRGTPLLAHPPLLCAPLRNYFVLNLEDVYNKDSNDLYPDRCHGRR